MSDKIYALNIHSKTDRFLVYKQKTKIMKMLIVQNLRKGVTILSDTQYVDVTTYNF